MGKNADFSDFYALVDKYKQAERTAFDEVSTGILTDAGNIVLRYVKTTKAHKNPTGLLRRSWRVGNIETHGLEKRISILNPVEYTGYVEKGTRYMEGRYMLKDALKTVEIKYMPKIVKKHIKKVLKT